VKVVAVRRLTTEFVWRDSGEPIASSEGDSDVLFDPDQCQLIVSMDADGVLFERLAGALNQEFEHDGYGLGDLSCLVAIIKEEPARIDQILTRLRVSKIEETRAEHIDTSDEIDYVDEQFGPDAHGDEGSDHEPLAGEAEDSPQSSVEGDDERSDGGEAPAAEIDTDEPDDESRLEDGVAGVRAATGARDRTASGRHSPRDSNGERPPLESGHGEGGEPPKPSAGRSRSRPTPAHSRRAVTYTQDSSSRSGQHSDRADDGRRSEVDEAAISLVLRFEQEQGRAPEKMPHNNPGYDVESKSQTGDVERYIEVKGLSGPWSEYGVGLSPTQHGYGHRVAEQFWLYVVEFALDKSRTRLYAIRNPISLIDEYRFDGGWKQLSTETKALETRAEPRVGDRIVVGGNREGVVEKIHQRGKLKQLRICFDDGETKALVYNATRMRVIPEEKE
jgi:hypothetical protein